MYVIQFLNNYILFIKMYFNYVDYALTYRVNTIFL